MPSAVQCRSPPLNLTTVFLEFPVSVIERTDLTCFEPSRDAMKVEGMVTDAPSHGAFIASDRGLVRLALNAEIHNVVTADGTVVDHYVPRPQSHCVPLLDFEALLLFVLAIGVAGFASLLGDRGGAGRIGHVDVRHVVMTSIVEKGGDLIIGILLS